MKKNMKYIKTPLLVLCLCCWILHSCREEIEVTNMRQNEPSAIGQPIEFDFSFGESGGNTRATTPLSVDEIVYVTPDKGETYYTYRYDENEERWKCTNTTNPLTWTAIKMKLWAFVGNNGTGAPTITADQATNGYEGSDFLGSYGEYTYTNGVVKMKLEHKVARLQVKVTGSIDPSVLSCTTNSLFNTSANIVLDDAAVSLTAAGETESFKLYRSSFTKDDENAANNTTNFTAYILPDDNFKTVFTLKCGGTLTYVSSELAVPLKAGKTSQINIALPVIKKVTDFSAAATNTGTAQEYSVQITGWYQLEVWGAEGGSYYYWTHGWSEYDNQMRGDGVCAGGMGGYVKGKVYLKRNDKLYVYVGKAGIGDYTEATLVSGTQYDFYGGWNGGGLARMAQTVKATITAVGAGTVESGTRTQGGGGGGGATDISLKNTGSSWKDANHLKYRIIVAGGGGGGAYVPSQKGWYTGGYGGGGSTWAGADGDGDANSRGLGGTLTQGGAVGRGEHNDLNLADWPKEGGFGYGGSGHWGDECMGAGGGGWYGGGCCLGTNSNGAGGGGSSWAYTTDYNGQDLTTYHPDPSNLPESRFLLTDVSNLSGNYVQILTPEEFATTTIEGARSSAWGNDGHARITILLE